MLAAASSLHFQQYKFDPPLLCPPGDSCEMGTASSTRVPVLRGTSQET
jgi:hypothetical protein